MSSNYIFLLLGTIYSKKKKKKLQPFTPQMQFLHANTRMLLRYVLFITRRWVLGNNLDWNYKNEASGSV